MSSKLTTNDYVSILKFYNLRIPKSKRLLSLQAEKIMAEKLCKCIKKVNSTTANEAKSIGICTKTVFNSKGYTRGNFQCKKKQSVRFRKTGKLLKRNKTLKI
jgi:inner membrane protein involved in colicin E2 resistance